MIQGYGVIVLFFVLAISLCTVIFALAFLLGPRRPYSHKNAPYECGFEQSGSINQPFHVRYALVAILFVLFDLEIAFLLPWAVSLKVMSSYGVGVGFCFLGILTAGFYYEWKAGALHWY